ncbi:MAG: ATP-binding cassette domain-containing protein [Marinilabiliales bacterium]|nr:ATP-binding cassette domain-containing protein [Marinilabiliales bacterium]
MSISVKNTSKYYGKQKALKGVSFSIDSGEIVGFLGPNGAGKSTMMKIITAYMEANEGEVLVNGLDVQKDELASEEIGWVFARAQPDVSGHVHQRIFAVSCRYP